MKTLLYVPLVATLAAVPLACASAGSTPDDFGGDAGAGSGGRSSSGGTSGGMGGEPGAGGHLGGHGGELPDDPCCLLGAVCHVTGGSEDPEVEACHELGHENVESACAANFDRCMALCEGLSDDPVPHACSH